MEAEVWLPVAKLDTKFHSRVCCSLFGGCSELKFTFQTATSLVCVTGLQPTKLP